MASRFGEEVEVPEVIRGDERLHPRARAGCTRPPSVRRSARSARRSRRGTRPRRTWPPLRASSAAGTRSDHRRATPRARRPAATRRARSSTAPSVPRYGLRSERTVNDARRGVVQPAREHRAERSRRSRIPRGRSAARVRRGCRAPRTPSRRVWHDRSRSHPRELRFAPWRCRLWTIVVDAHDPRTLGHWWADALGWKIFYEDADGDEVVVTTNDERFPGIVFVRVPEAKTTKNRLHLDFVPDDRDAEVERLPRAGRDPSRDRAERRRGLGRARRSRGQRVLHPAARAKAECQPDRQGRRASAVGFSRGAARALAPR